MTKLTQHDQDQLDSLGIKSTALESQLKLFKNGIKPITLTAPAQVNSGILSFSEASLNKYIEKFEASVADLTVTRFVPASGAASRMFKTFFQFLDDGVESDEVVYFSKSSKNLPFYDEIKCDKGDNLYCEINKMINSLKLAELPKALIPFHHYREGIRTAFEEHLVEAAMVMNNSEAVSLHFTISKLHQAKFKVLLQNKLRYYSDKQNCSFNIEFSYQENSTDTIAVNAKNQPVRNEDNSLLFRPGGHGALIENLNNLDEDLIFIKNIDNIQPDHLKGTTVKYKKSLAGYLLSLIVEIRASIISLTDEEPDFLKVKQFLIDSLYIELPTNFDKLEDSNKIELLYDKLNRPVRVCGMVKNEGEPGGGPFWVKNMAGEVSTQIVESSQVSHSDKFQEDIFQQSTHFNPVDIVCWTKDFKGAKFNLNEFVDPETAFITEKSQNGQIFKVLEHPGLWNGAMANWITVFVEVPACTFSPVKTITDLLRKEHQPN